MFFKKVVSILVICIVAQSVLAEESKQDAASENVLNELSWSCANNASCVTRLARDVVQKLKARKPVDFGAFSIEPVEKIPLTVEGRSSRALDFFSGNALKFPIGPVLFNVERSADYPNFIEVSLLRKDDGARGKTRKHMRFFVPAFLVFSQIGWYALAIAGVKLLAIKAFLVAKIALIVVAMMTFKKLMEPVAVLPPPYFDHQEPYLMPYSMDFHHGFPGSGHDMYPMGLGGHLGHHDGPAALHAAEGLGAASNVNAVVDTNQAADKSASVASGASAAAASSNDRHHFPGGKIKRQDFYPAMPSAKYY
ncbi:uncharacterized protein LOC131435645 [Malaya genurostris]|uniref:uncharacterized protein LOC131435645 n=1 Tax=Malaya genurostris TaxID=325434 RepID=UPI0026F39337|nr:uncharacterized protein LOC131435645 [Malaya genurostris]